MIDVCKSCRKPSKFTLKNGSFSSFCDRCISKLEEKPTPADRNNKKTLKDRLVF